MMTAVLCTGYGGPEVLEVAQVPRPLPRDNQILIKIHNTTVTLGDCELRALKLADWIWLPARLAFGITKPRNPVLGMEVAGIVEAVGNKVSRFLPGDRVFGSTSFAMGTYAQYQCVSENAPIVKMPERLAFPEAAGIPTGGLNGLHFLRHAGVRGGEHVAINGAGGSIGCFAIQLAKRMGAIVTAIDAAEKHDLLKSLGADQVVDYRTADFAAQPERYDVIIDVIGKSVFTASLKALKPSGRYVLGNPRFWPMMRGWLGRHEDNKKVLFKPAGEGRAELEELADLVASGAVRVPIDRSFDLRQMREAHAYVESGAKRGIISINVAD